MESQPNAILHAATSALTARLRGVKLLHTDGRVDQVLQALREWVGRRKVGFVHGLARGHEPMHDSWDGDARAALARLNGSPEVARPTIERAPDASLSNLTTSASTMSVPELRAAVFAALEAVVAADGPRLCNALHSRHEDLLDDGRFARVRKAVRSTLKRATQPPGSIPKDAPPAECGLLAPDPRQDRGHRGR